jgi:hypothetical protein
VDDINRMICDAVAREKERIRSREAARVAAHAIAINQAMARAAAKRSGWGVWNEMLRDMNNSQA